MPLVCINREVGLNIEVSAGMVEDVDVVGNCSTQVFTMFYLA